MLILNLLYKNSKISQNQHLNFHKIFIFGVGKTKNEIFSFFWGGWVGKTKNEIIPFFLNVDIFSRFLTRTSVQYYPQPFEKLIVTGTQWSTPFTFSLVIGAL